MELGKIAAYQVAIIFILIAVGFGMKKRGQISEHGVRDMTNLLLNVVTPCVLVRAYQKPFEESLALGLLRCAGLAVISHAVGILLASLVFRKKDETKHNRINIFCAVYSNCGFMAIPLMQALLGDAGVFYGATYLAVFTPLYWTHGVAVYTGGVKELSWKKAILNPGVLGTVVSVILFVCRITLPNFLMESAGYMAYLNTPVAMVILGTFLAGVNFRKAFGHLSLYAVSFLRLLLIPLITLGIAYLLPMSLLEVQSVLLPAACPAATVATLFAARFHLDAEYSSELVAITTLVSIVTIPLIMSLSAIIL